MRLAILPVYKSYSKISVAADFIAARWISQINDKNIKLENVILFEQFNNRNEAEELNHQTVNDCKKFENSLHETFFYKGLSIIDIDIRQIWVKVFSNMYRETLSILSCIKEKGIKLVIIEKQDPWFFIFQEILPQLGVELEAIDQFGIEDKHVSLLLKKEFPIASSLDFHRIRKVIWKARVYNAIVNLFSFLTRMIKGKRPFILFSVYKPLEPVKDTLLSNQNYYPILYQANCLSFWGTVKRGIKLVAFDYRLKNNRNILEMSNRYKALIESSLESINVGVVEGAGFKVTVIKSLTAFLKDKAEEHFLQIASNIDIFDKMFKKNNIKGYLGFCDSPWEERLLVRLSQRENIPNVILINGVLSNAFFMEAKTVDTVMVYGESQKDNYFKNYQGRTIVVGNPLYESAYKRRGVKKIEHPPKRILVGTSDISPGDINCQYSSTETFLKNVNQALNSLKPEYNFEVSLKLHPGESREFYEWLVDREGIKIKEILNSGNMQEILMNYDLLIINHSVAVIEASLIGMPVLYYHPARQVLYDPFGGYRDLPSAFTAEELSQTLKRIFENKEFAHTFTDTLKLAPFTGPLDGHAKDRITETVNNFVEY
jgi:hypothetical protein